MQYKNIFKMFTEICIKTKRFIECVKTELHYNFSYFSQCIASQLESNFLKSPAYYESTKHYRRLHTVRDTMKCTQSVHRFRGQLH